MKHKMFRLGFFFFFGGFSIDFMLLLPSSVFIIYQISHSHYSFIIKNKLNKTEFKNEEITKGLEHIIKYLMKLNNSLLYPFVTPWMNYYFVFVQLFISNTKSPFLLFSIVLQVATNYGNVRLSFFLYILHSYQLARNNNYTLGIPEHNNYCSRKQKYVCSC